MITHQAIAKGRYYLTHDEVITVKRRQNHEFRVRVWMGKGRDPLVLATQVNPRGSDPAEFSEKIASKAFAELLRYTGDMEYYEYSRLCGLNRIYFHSYGTNPLRPMYVGSNHEEVDTAYFARRVGGLDFND